MASWLSDWDVSSGSGASGYEWSGYDDDDSTSYAGWPEARWTSDEPTSGTASDYGSDWSAFQTGSLSTTSDHTEDEAFIADAVAFSSTELPRGALMSHKIPPAYDGMTPWFQYEELVYDWIDSCTLEEERRGPALKNRLHGAAAVHKPLLDRHLLKDKQDGVEYFL